MSLFSPRDTSYDLNHDRDEVGLAFISNSFSQYEGISLDTAYEEVKQCNVSKDVVSVCVYVIKGVEGVDAVCGRG